MLTLFEHQTAPFAWDPPHLAALAPPNLTILGTLNTADRSIALLDLSLLRMDMEGINLQALLDPDHQIGHSYLMGVGTAEGLHFAWYRRVVPLLQEYFYHDGERLQAVLGSAFVRKVMPDAETREALGAMAEVGARYEVEMLEGEEFLKALQGLTG